MEKKEIKKFNVNFQLTGVEIEYLNSMIADRIANLDIKMCKFGFFEG